MCSSSSGGGANSNNLGQTGRLMRGNRGLAGSALDRGARSGFVYRPPHPEARCRGDDGARWSRCGAVTRANFCKIEGGALGGMQFAALVQLFAIWGLCWCISCGVGVGGVKDVKFNKKGVLFCEYPSLRWFLGVKGHQTKKQQPFWGSPVSRNTQMIELRHVSPTSTSGLLRCNRPI